MAVQSNVVTITVGVGPLTPKIVATLASYQGQPSARIVGTGFTPNSSPTLYVNDPQNNPPNQTILNATGTGPLGQLGFDWVVGTGSTIDTISFTMQDAPTGIFSNGVFVTFPAFNPTVTWAQNRTLHTLVFTGLGATPNSTVNVNRDSGSYGSSQGVANTDANGNWTDSDWGAPYAGFTGNPSYVITDTATKTVIFSGNIAVTNL